MAVGASPWEEWSQDHKLCFQTQKASAKIGPPCSIQGWKAAGALSAEERWKPLGTNPPSFFFPLKGQSTGCVFAATHLGPQGREAGMDWSRSRRGWRERNWGEIGGVAVGFWGLGYIPGLHNNHLSWEDLAPPGVKSFTLLCKIPLPTPSGILLTTPSKILFTLPCTVFVLFLSFTLSWCFVCFFFFFPPILHLNPCWRVSNMNRLRGFQRLAVGCSQP